VVRVGREPTRTLSVDLGLFLRQAQASLTTVVASNHSDGPPSAINTGIRTTISKVVRPAVNDAPGTAA
jgi:hypothetical protein